MQAKRRSAGKHSVLRPLPGVCALLSLRWASGAGKFTCTNVQTRALQHLRLGDMQPGSSLGSSVEPRGVCLLFSAALLYSRGWGREGGGSIQGEISISSGGWCSGLACVNDFLKWRLGPSLWESRADLPAQREVGKGEGLAKAGSGRSCVARVLQAPKSQLRGVKGVLRNVERKQVKKPGVGSLRRKAQPLQILFFFFFLKPIG